MGVMSASMTQVTGNMAAMSGKVDGIAQELKCNSAQMEEKKKHAEQTFQKYAQSYVDADIAVYRRLKRIHKELSEMKKLLKGVNNTSNAFERKHSEANIESVINHLESRLKTLNKRVNRLAETSH